MFWNISRISFFLFSIQDFKSNCYIIFSNFFNHLFLMQNLFLFSYIFYKRFNFCHSLRIFHLTVPACWKHLLSFLLGFIVAFLFCIQSGESIYDAPWFGFIYDIYKPITEQSQRQTHYLSLIPNYFDIYFLVNHKVILWLHLLHH